MKTKKDLYNNALKYENALEIFKKIKRTCKNRSAVLKFEYNLNTNIYSILNKLYQGKYNFSKYKIFMINDPKYRIIMSENIYDKLVNHLISKYILQTAIESKLIDTNVSTRINKGSRYALNKFKEYVSLLKHKNKEIYVLKLDIKKYFYNIDHETLIKLVKKYINDKKSIYILKQIINSTNYPYINERIYELKKEKIYKINHSRISQEEKNIKINMVNSIPYYKNGKGLPIGNMTSQIFAVFYLNNVDHFIKEKLKFKYYIRYMDDLIILDTDKTKLLNAYKLIEKEVNNLKLELNSKSNLYKLSKGVVFLGYKFTLEKNKLNIKYNNRTIRKINKKLKNLCNKDIEHFKRSYNSYRGYIDYSNTKYKEKFYKYYNNKLNEIKINNNNI